jgi:N-acyl-D-amino-acid deacylase
VRRLRRWFWGAVFAVAYRGQQLGFPPRDFTLIVRNGVVHDGLRGEPLQADIGIVKDRIVAIGDLSRASAQQELDARGLAVAPGFINTLSWATESLLVDPTGESDIRQGVTLEVFGEGVSMGPMTPAMRRALEDRHRDRNLHVDWQSLGEYLERLERRGVVPNVASLVGASTVRTHVMGYAHREADRNEVAQMCQLVRESMREGALGVGSALIYAPAACASRTELLALASTAAEFGGAYFSHVRSETAGLVAAVDEVIDIARATRQHAEVYHLKAAGRANWHLADAVIERIEAARRTGVDVSANMYPYTIAATGLDAAMPPWVQEGGAEHWFARLDDPNNRERLLREIGAPGEGWENLYHAAGSAERVHLLGLRQPHLRELNGMTLAAVAAARGVSAEQTMIDLVREDRSRVTAAFDVMSERNVERQLALPWVALCSDAEALAPRGTFLDERPHPRAYGSFARFLGQYVRERRVAMLPEAIRRLTSLPARNLKLRDRGELRPGAYADIVVFDPTTISDHATIAEPHRFSTGVEHVIVNGQVVLRDGAMTGLRPGRFVRGPGFNVTAAEVGEQLPKAAG